MKATKFDDVKRRKFLEGLDQGLTRGESARSCGVSRETVRLHAREDKELARQISEAEANASEAVEEALYQAALSGNVTACLAWLYSRVPERWQDKRAVAARPAAGAPAPHAPSAAATRGSPAPKRRSPSRSAARRAA